MLCLIGTVQTACSDSSPVETQDPGPIEEPAIPDELTSDVIAFVGVNVLPMNEERVLMDHTVLIRNGSIEALGPKNIVTVPQGADRIEVRDAYLIPGLSDMNTHMVSNLPDGENDLFLYVANGVTTVRVIDGDQTILQWRDEIAGGSRLGPTMHVSGSPLDGEDSGDRFLITNPLNIATAEEGREAVREQQAAGYDYVTIYNTLEPDVYDAIMDEASILGIKAIGHIPVAVSLEQAIAAGQYSTEHLNPFARSVVERSGPGRWEGEFLDTRAAEGAATMAASTMWNCPTLASYQRNDAPQSATRSDNRYASPALSRNFYPTANEPTTPENTRRMVRALHDAGARLILGTWTGIRYLLPGFAVSDELAALTGSGLTAFEALETTTANVAEYFGDTADIGTIEVGNRADLVLLDSNPLDRVRNVERRVGVMVRGHWFSEKRLQERLETIATSYGK
ncbi:MAG: amidohydrolase family protein [Rhodothermales bacterium]